MKLGAINIPGIPLELEERDLYLDNHPDKATELDEVENFIYDISAETDTEEYRRIIFNLLIVIREGLKDYTGVQFILNNPDVFAKCKFIHTNPHLKYPPSLYISNTVEINPKLTGIDIRINSFRYPESKNIAKLVKEFDNLTDEVEKLKLLYKHFDIIWFKFPYDESFKR